MKYKPRYTFTKVPPVRYKGWKPNIYGVSGGGIKTALLQRIIRGIEEVAGKAAADNLRAISDESIHLRRKNEALEHENLWLRSTLKRATFGSNDRGK